jgi:hypothetical protein
MTYGLRGSFFYRYSNSFLVALVWAANELDDIFVRTAPHCLEGDDYRYRFLERVVGEKEAFAFGNDVGLDDSFVGGPAE